MKVCKKKLHNTERIQKMNRENKSRPSAAQAKKKREDGKNKREKKRFVGIFLPVGWETFFFLLDYLVTLSVCR